MVWRLLLYLGTGGAVVYFAALVWKSRSSRPGVRSAALLQDMYGESALLVGALLPAFLMGYSEGRSVDDYGLPRRQAFGKLFLGSARCGGWLPSRSWLIAMRGCTGGLLWALGFCTAPAS